MVGSKRRYTYGITAGVFISVYRVLSQQSVEARIYRLLKKKFVHDPAATLIDTLLHNGRAATGQLTCLSQNRANMTIRQWKTNDGSLSGQMQWFGLSVCH